MKAVWHVTLAFVGAVVLFACDERESQAKVDEAYARCTSKIPKDADRVTKPPVAPNPHLYKSSSAPAEPSLDEQRAVYRKALNMQSVCDNMRAECRRSYLSISCQAELNSNGKP